MSGNDFLEWETHAGSGESTPVYSDDAQGQLSPDGRVPVYLSKRGMFYTLLGGYRREWKGAEPTITQTGDVLNFNDFTLRGQKESWWINRFSYQIPKDDTKSKQYRKSLPKADPFVIADSGQLVDAQYGQLLPYQPSIRSDRGDFLNADSYIYPQKFINMLPGLSKTYPKLSDLEIYRQYLKSLDAPAEQPEPPEPEQPEQPPAEQTAPEQPQQPQTQTNATQPAEQPQTNTTQPQQPPPEDEEDEPIIIPVVEQEDNTPDSQLLLPAPDTSGQDTDSIFDGSLTPYHLNILEAPQAQHALSIYDNRASQVQSGLHRGQNIETDESKQQQQASPRPFGQILEVYA